LRDQRRWSQAQLVTELHLIGNINVTREIIANIETLRSPVSDKQIEFFAQVFGVMEQDLFPKKRHFVGKEAGMELREFTRRRGPPRPPQK
ncbi:MAG TPA: helix-turn-helix transcriptional regulator, partial [Candidatus Angelobacter sp.]|nr:helix-turn-helix transcriptional regulator [Candidatus Angelobacter sp.]